MTRAKSFAPRIWNFALVCAGIFVVTLLLAAPALAQEESGNHPENSTLGWVMRWVNSGIVIIAIGWGLSKCGPAFRKRADGIQAAIAEGKRAREEAAERRKEAEQRLAGLPAEIAGMRADAKRDAEAETQRIRELAREDAAKMDHAADLEIEAAERAAMLELKATAARLAVERAEKLLREHLTQPADARLVRNFAGELAGSRN